MKKLLIILFTFLLLGCAKETTDEVLEPVFEISLDGVQFDPFERYKMINTFGGSKWVDGKLKKIFILYLQIDDGEARLDRQHFALYLLDSDATFLHSRRYFATTFEARYVLKTFAERPLTIVE